eukprot:GFUD01015541.1.p1 GENE.GFUD01015541.1~~GFUD01015541.1.p1  ORF type:complete len:313 (+),score=98.07 GFUD01015541.1:52-990(+)
MPPVTCYICGRDFGTRSIGIHIPNCQKKWDAEQEKLPKKERRPMPTAPENFDKVVSGEIKGKDLVKMNQKAFEDYNESALESCQFCGRTFLPTALVSHRRACTEEKPMVKHKAGYTSQMKAKVKYPKLKSKSEKKTAEVKIMSSTKVEDKTAENVESKENVDDTPEDSVSVSIEVDPPISPVANGFLSDEVKQNSHDEEMDEESPLKEINPKASIKRGTGTFRKKPSFVKEVNNKNIPSKDDIIAFVENETMFDSQEHRREIMNLMTKYAKDARKKEVLEILDHKVFEEEDSIDEVVKMMNEFIQQKTNNNM